MALHENSLRKLTGNFFAIIREIFRGNRERHAQIRDVADPASNPYNLAWASQSSGTGLRMIRSSVRFVGWRPSRIALWIAGDEERQLRPGANVGFGMPCCGGDLAKGLASAQVGHPGMGLRESAQQRAIGLGLAVADDDLALHAPSAQCEGSLDRAGPTDRSHPAGDPAPRRESWPAASGRCGASRCAPRPGSSASRSGVPAESRLARSAHPVLDGVAPLQIRLCADPMVAGERDEVPLQWRLPRPAPAPSAGNRQPRGSVPPEISRFET